MPDLNPNLADSITGAELHHVLNLRRHPASDVTTSKFSDDVANHIVVPAADFRNDFRRLQQENKGYVRMFF